jgi:hypothetical protein
MSTTPKNNDKRGRKKGSTDSVFVTLETLSKYLKPNMAIPIRRKFIEQIEAVHQVKFVTENDVQEVEVAVSIPVFAEESAAAKAESIRPHLDLNEETL